MFAVAKYWRQPVGEVAALAVEDFNTLAEAMNEAEREQQRGGR